MLQRVLLCLENQIKYNVDLMSAMSMLADAWKAVLAGTISNCFRHAGFTLRSEPDTADTAAEEPNNATEEPDLPPSASSSGFANVDSAVSSCAVLNDDMIEQVLQPSNSGSDSDDDDAPCAPEPSHADLSRALAVLSWSYSDRITLAEYRRTCLHRAPRIKETPTLRLYRVCLYANQFNTELISMGTNEVKTYLGWVCGSASQNGSDADDCTTLPPGSDHGDPCCQTNKPCNPSSAAHCQIEKLL
ncbi:hypothetical protein HPB51_017135 [Rhipicephalus microplus]|uniref:Uncharacterized protein n=1 Tax=Rhipicephalus microplus TaxID=6941 RepID=A0A9J6DWG2_RHIMP|nr:hypothetical protein HPB51_017135 [Rhipicephalus microplus]